MFECRSLMNVVDVTVDITDEITMDLVDRRAPVRHTLLLDISMETATKTTHEMMSSSVICHWPMLCRSGQRVALGHHAALT